MSSKLVVVRRFPALVHAELARSALAAYDIDAAINHATGRPLRPDRATTIDVLVREEDVEAALDILGPADERFSE